MTIGHQRRWEEGEEGEEEKEEEGEEEAEGGGVWMEERA